MFEGSRSRGCVGVRLVLLLWVVQTAACGADRGPAEPTSDTDAGTGSVPESEPESVTESEPATVPESGSEPVPESVPSPPSLDWNLAQDCRVARVAVGGRHACGVTVGGHVVCWGHDGSHQLGVGELPDSCAVGDVEVPCSESAVAVPELEDVRALALSNDGSCALDGSGVVWCWGTSASDVFSPELTAACDDPRIDDGPGLSCSPFPVAIDGIDEAVDIGAWGTHCAAERSGAVKCWVAHMGRLPTPVPDVRDAVQTDFACARGADGAVQCWWCNDRGQRGDGNLGPPQEVGVASNCELSTSTVAFEGTATDVVSGYHHACLVDDAGGVHCWGDDLGGQLGVPAGALEACNYDEPCSTVPLRVPGLEPAVQVAAGIRSTCVRTVDGEVRCLEGSARPRVQLPAPAAHIAMRYARGCAALEDGRVFCWSGGSGPDGDTIAATEVDVCAGR
jgi:hypothetical protein